MQEHIKIQLINSIKTEDELRTELIVPLFRKIGYKVYDNQGPEEFGTDVILKETNNFGREQYTSIVLKCGDIDNKSGSPTGILRVLNDQAFQAAKTPLSHPDVGKNTYPNTVIIVTNGKISRNARSIFNKMIREQFESITNFDYFDKNDLVGLIDKHWPEFYEDRRPFVSQYAKKLKDDLLGAQIIELATGNGCQRSLDSVFIPQLLTKNRDIGDFGREGLNIKSKPLTPIDLISLKKDIIYITGEAGSGKSTLLKRLAIDVAEQAGSVPLYISARDLLKARGDINGVYRKIAEYDDRSNPDEVAEELSNSVSILMVDGLDEIRDPLKRVEVIEAIESIVDTGSRVTKAIVTSRPESESDVLALTRSKDSYLVMPVEDSQVNKFFMKWFDNTTKASKLFHDLTRKSVLDKLPKTPLTLTLLAVLYETKEDVPTTLTELYKMFVELLLGKWDVSKGIDSVKDTQVRFGLLSHLAWEMHQNGNDIISQNEALIMANDFLINKLGDNKTDALVLLQDVIDRSGLLAPKNTGIKFKHLSFQEFFCAQEIYCRDVFKENLMAWIYDAWWSNVLFFSAGAMGTIDDYVEKIIDDDPGDADTVDRFAMVHSLGGMLQSAYKTSKKKKNILIQYSSKYISSIIEDVAGAIRESHKGVVPRFVPYAAVIDMLSDNFTSTYLVASLREVLSGTKLVDDNKLEKIFICSALAKSGDSDGLTDLITDPCFTDPLLLLLSDMFLDDYDEKYNGGKITQVHKSVKKKIKKNVPAVKMLLNMKLE